MTPVIRSDSRSHQTGLATTVGARAAGQFIAIRPWEIVTLGMALVVSFVLYLAGGYIGVAYIAPLSILGIMGIANWQMVRQSPASLWTPLFAFRTAGAVFLGFGGFLTVNLSIEAAARYFSELTYTEQEAAHVFLVWLAGTFITLFACFLASKTGSGGLTYAARATDDDAPTLRLGILYFGAGLAFYVLIEVPKILGWADIGIIPNAVSQPFQAAFAVGVFLICLWALEKGGPALLAIPFVVTISSMAGFIGLNKTGVLLPLIFFVLAFLYRKISVFRIMVVVGLLAAAFAVLQPMVAHARNQVGGEIANSLTLGERFDLYRDYFVAADADQNSADAETDFLRFGHTHVAAFVIDRYDSGMPSDELEGALAALVPRVIWPDKPIVTQGAEELYFLVSGRQGSALATTTFADMYWNAGWIGLFFLSFIWGMLMWVGTRTAFVVVSTRDWFMMPYVLLVFRIGLSLESAFVVAVFVPTVMAVIAYFMFKGLRAVLPQDLGPALGFVQARRDRLGDAVRSAG